MAKAFKYISLMLQKDGVQKLLQIIYQKTLVL